MKKTTYTEIFEFLNDNRIEYEYYGNKNDYIISMCNLEEIEDHNICWIKKKKNLSSAVLESIQQHEGVLIIAPFQVDNANIIVTDYPKGTFFSILNKFFYNEPKPMLSTNSIILSDNIGKNVHIGDNSYIGPDVIIGNNTVIHQNVVIKCPCEIGESCEINSGVVIGTDGFGYYRNTDDIYEKERHYKGVIIGDNVDIGANTNIDRGLLSNTVIGSNTKIDALCKVGHNVVIEENCLIIAGTILCGSSRIKKNSYLAPASVVLNQVTVGEQSTVGVNSVAMWKVNDNTTIMGTPGAPFLPKSFRNKKR